MLRYHGNLKAIRYESTSLNRIVADKSHRVIAALFYHAIMRRNQLYKNPCSGGASRYADAQLTALTLFSMGGGGIIAPLPIGFSYAS